MIFIVITASSQTKVVGHTWSNAKTYEIVTDAAGDSYVTGYFRKTVDFDPGPAVVNYTTAVAVDPKYK